MNRTRYYKVIQLSQMRSFCLVATQENFTAAARELGLTKPTVWQQVRALEREIGSPLFRRRGRAVELTAEGRVLLELVQPHVSGLDSLPRLFEDRKAGLARQLTVVSTPYLSANHLLPVVREFNSRHPSVRLNLRADVNAEDGLKLIERGQADIGVLSLMPDELAGPDLEHEHLFDLPFVLMAAPDHPLARKKKVAPRDLVQHPVIIGQSHNRTALESLLRLHGLLDRLNVVLQTGSTEIARRYVGAGIGVALLYCSRSMPEIHTRVFDPRMPGLPVVAAVRKGAHLPESVKEFRDCVRRHLGRPEEKPSV